MAWVIKPPLQPSLPCEVEQSTKFCSERLTKVLVAKKWQPSTEPVVENDQQEPH
jgi:hypothetical protein